MTQTVTVRDAIIAELKAESALGAVRTIAYHGGPVDEKELAAYGPHAPAMLLTWLGCPESRYPHASQVFTSWAIFIVTRQRTRHTESQNLHDLLCRHLLHGTSWGGAACGIPEKVNTRNLYSRTFDQAGLQVVVVQWDQWIELVEDDGSTLPDFEMLATCYGPEGAEDTLWSEQWAVIFGASCIVGELQTMET